MQAHDKLGGIITPSLFVYTSLRFVAQGREHGRLNDCLTRLNTILFESFTKEGRILNMKNNKTLIVHR